MLNAFANIFAQSVVIWLTSSKSMKIKIKKRKHKFYAGNH